MNLGLVIVIILLEERYVSLSRMASGIVLVVIIISGGNFKFEIRLKE